MSKEHIELAAVAVIVVVVLAAVALIAMSVLANDEEPEPQHAQGFTIPIDYGDGRADASVVASHYAQAFSWPRGGEYLSAARSVEPVRETFRQMLEGGPDYRG